MQFLKLLELVMAVFVAVVLVTQVMVPLWNDRQVFPFFRKREKLQRELTAVHETADTTALAHTIATEREAISAEQPEK